MAKQIIEKMQEILETSAKEGSTYESSTLLKALQPVQSLAHSDQSYEHSSWHLEELAKQKAAKSLVSLIKGDGQAPRPVSEFMKEKIIEIEEQKEKEYVQRLEELRSRHASELEAKNSVISEKDGEIG